MRQRRAPFRDAALSVFVAENLQACSVVRRELAAFLAAATRTGTVAGCTLSKGLPLPRDRRTVQTARVAHTVR